MVPTGKPSSIKRLIGWDLEHKVEPPGASGNTETCSIFEPRAFKITSGNANKYFEAVLGLTISTTTISYLFIFPALIKLRHSRSEVDRPYRVPWGTAGAWICSVVPTFWALLATVALIWPGFGVGWFGTGGNPNDDLAELSFSHQRQAYELSQIVPLAVIVVIGVIFYALGRNTRAETATEPVTGAPAPAGESGPVAS
jgi:amino acid transporter